MSRSDVASCTRFTGSSRFLCLTPAAAVALLKEHSTCIRGCNSQQFAIEELLAAFAVGAVRLDPPSARDLADSVLEFLDAKGRDSGGSTRLKAAAINLLPAVFLLCPELSPAQRVRVVAILLEKLRLWRADVLLQEALCVALATVVREKDCRDQALQGNALQSLFASQLAHSYDAGVQTHVCKALATLAAAEPSAGVSALGLNGMESVITSALVPHKADPQAVQAACNALTWFLRGGLGDAAVRAAKLGLPRILSEVTFSALSSEHVVAAAVADLFAALLGSADAHAPYAVVAAPSRSRNSTGAAAKATEDFQSLPRQMEQVLIQGSGIQKLVQAGLANPSRTELSQSIARLTAALFRDRPNSLALTSAAVSAGTIKFICDMLLLPPQTAGTPGQAAAAVPELGAGGLAALEAFAAVACSGAAAVSGSSTRGALDWAVTRGIVERISTVACDHCCGDDALSGSSAKVEEHAFAALTALTVQLGLAEAQTRARKSREFLRFLRKVAADAASGKPPAARSWGEQPRFGAQPPSDAEQASAAVAARCTEVSRAIWHRGSLPQNVLEKSALSDTALVPTPPPGLPPRGAPPIRRASTGTSTAAITSAERTVAAAAAAAVAEGPTPSTRGGVFGVLRMHQARKAALSMHSGGASGAVAAAATASASQPWSRFMAAVRRNSDRPQDRRSARGGLDSAALAVLLSSSRPQFSRGATEIPPSVANMVDAASPPAGPARPRRRASVGHVRSNLLPSSALMSRGKSGGGDGALRRSDDEMFEESAASIGSEGAAGAGGMGLSPLKSAASGGWEPLWAGPIPPRGARHSQASVQSAFALQHGQRSSDPYDGTGGFAQRGGGGLAPSTSRRTAADRRRSVSSVEPFVAAFARGTAREPELAARAAAALSGAPSS